MADAQELAKSSKSPIGKLELERLLLDALKRAIETDHPPATNDNQSSWSLIPFPDGWYGGA